MSRCASIPSRRMLVLFPFLAGFVLPAAATPQARVSESYGKLPLHFEANRGQTDKDVRFLSRGAGYSLYLTASEAVLVLSKPNARNTSERRDAQAPVNSVALRMNLVGAARRPLVSGLDEQPGKANYFIGKDPAKWRTNVPTHAKVHYQNVYPGVDLVYYGNQRQLEYDFVVEPGADPKKIVLGFKGADKLEIDATGDLVLRATGGDIRQHKPIIYQNVDGIRREIAGSYVRKGANRVGFEVAAYDRSRPLIIDPVLAYSTYLGGNGFEGAGGIAVDRDRNAYVTGFTTSTDFPTTPGAFETAFHGVAGSLGDAFVTKFDPTGSALVYSAYLGGSNQDSATRIAVDADGNAYVTGGTSSADFPTTAGAFQTTLHGSVDTYVTKLNPAGSSLVYSTYLGGSGNEGDSDIAVDPLGNAYVTGSTGSLDFPTTLGAFQPAFAGGPSCPDGDPSHCPPPVDAFVTKLNATGSALVYSTFLGGSGNDSGTGITTDADGNAYVTGRTDSLLFPTTPGTFQPVSALTGGISGSNAFVTKFPPTGSPLVYSTYLGGNGQDGAFAIAVDSFRNAYVAGTTTSLNFPTTVGAFRTTTDGSGDTFVTKLDPSAAVPVYSTFLGNGTPAGIAVDAAGNAFVAGSTHSTSFPTTADAFQPALAGGADSFVTKLNPAGSGLVYSTYLGGSRDDFVLGIAVDTGGCVYVAGQTFSANFPIANAFQPTFAGGPPLFGSFVNDAFVAKIADVVP